MSETMQAAKAPGWFSGLIGQTTRRPLLVLALFCLTLWAPGVFSLPPLDRDESRFAQSSKQMLESGDFIDIHFGMVPRYKKPVGIYWMQSAATAVAGWGDRNHIWTYRLPSLMGAIAAVWLTFWCARAFAAADTAFMAAALLGATLLMIGEATIATTDAVLLACIMGAQGFLLRVYKAARTEGEAIPDRWTAVAGWFALGLGVLVKGPVALAVCGLTVLVLSLWDREWRWLKHTKPLLGLGIVLAVAAPWAIAIALRSHGHFYEQSLGQDFATKLQGGQETHGAPPGYFLALLSLTFWPATLFLLPGLWAAIRARGEPAIRFLLVWVGASWLMFELVPTKLPHYVLPVYPALAMLAALWVTSARETPTRVDRVLFHIAPVQFALGVLALTGAAVILPGKFGAGLEWWMIVAISLFALLGIGALIAYWRKAVLTAAACAFASVLVLYPALSAGVAPHLDRIWVSVRAAQAVKKLSMPDDPPAALAGYVEPSLVFLLGTETHQTNGRGAADVCTAQGGLALIEDRERYVFLARLAELEADATEVGSIDGFNYSHGKPVHIRIYRVTQVRETPPPPPE